MTDKTIHDRMSELAQAHEKETGERVSLVSVIWQVTMDGSATPVRTEVETHKGSA